MMPKAAAAEQDEGIEEGEEHIVIIKITMTDKDNYLYN